MRLVTRKGRSVVPHTVDVSAATLDSKGLLHGVAGLLVAERIAASPPQVTREGRHFVLKER